MRSWSIPAGRIFGVDIRIDLSFVLLLLFIGVIERASNIVINPVRGTALVAIMFGSVVLHELGHALVGRHSGVPPRAIILMPIGGVAFFVGGELGILVDWRCGI